MMEKKRGDEGKRGGKEGRGKGENDPYWSTNLNPSG